MDIVRAFFKANYKALVVGSAAYAAAFYAPAAYVPYGAAVAAFLAAKYLIFRR